MQSVENRISEKCRHFVDEESGEPYKSRLSADFVLFQLDGPGGLAGNIVEDAVDTIDLVDDPVHGGLEDLPGDVGGLGGHEVAGDDGA